MIYLHSSRQAPTGGGAIAEFFVDSPADIGDLPESINDISKSLKVPVAYSSTAFVLSTGDVYVLSGAGWVRL
jgi:hypothetical protein